MRKIFILSTTLIVLSLAVLILAARSSGESIEVDPASLVQQRPLDPVAATEALLASQASEVRNRADAYFEGSAWMSGFGDLLEVAMMALLLFTGWSAAMRDRAEMLTRFQPLRTLLYAWQFLLVTCLLEFPLMVYEGYVRERSYGFLTEDVGFGSWLRGRLIGLGIGSFLLGVFFVLLYGVIRRAPRTWWRWGAGVSVLGVLFVLGFKPVVAAFLSNDVIKLEDPAVRDSILRLAQANGIDADEVYVQRAPSTRIEAGVHGLWGTRRIVVNETLIKRCSPAEIEAVLGHEIAHCVLGHTFQLIVFKSLLTLLAFGFIHWCGTRLVGRWGQRWRVRGITDVAGLPLGIALYSAFTLLAAPIDRSFVRSMESEADLFGLNAARQPDAFATVALKLAEFRKLDPGPMEEMLLFDHPSGRSRIRMAMRWKAAMFSAAPGSQQ